MKKQVSTKQLLQTLLQTYMDTHDLKNIYKEDGSKLITVDEAVEFVDGLKEEASPDQVAFECALDNMMEEFRGHFMHNVLRSAVISKAEAKSREGMFGDGIFLID